MPAGARGPAPSRRLPATISNYHASPVTSRWRQKVCRSTHQSNPTSGLAAGATELKSTSGTVNASNKGLVYQHTHTHTGRVSNPYSRPLSINLFPLHARSRSAEEQRPRGRAQQPRPKREDQRIKAHQSGQIKHSSDKQTNKQTRIRSDGR